MAVNAEDLRKRVLIRFFDNEVQPSGEVCDEMIRTIEDRICIRLEAEELPKRAESIVVDASVKAIRLRGFEGSRSEAASEGGSISSSFIDDVLEAYAEDIESLRRSVHSAGIKFL